MAKKVRYEDWIKKAITFLIILISGTAIYSIEQFTLLRSITLIILLGLLLFEFVNNNRFKRKKMFVFFLYAVSFFITLLLKAPNEAYGIITKMLFVIFLVNYCCERNNTHKIFEIVYEFIVVISAVALFFFIALFVFNMDLPSCYVGDGFYKSYFYLFFTQSGYAESIGRFSFYRLQSIFWEPGVFSVYLLLALYYYCFLAGKKHILHFWILTICLILTLSTTGLIVGIGMFLVFILKKMKSLQERILAVAPLCIVAIPVIVIVWMKKKNSTVSPSYSLRMYDMIRSLKIWGENLLFGVGYNNTTLFSMEGRIGNSNGFLNWCMTTGLLGLVFVILPFVVNCMISKSKERIRNVVFFGLFVLMNFTEPLIQTPIMLLLISMSYAALIEKRGLIDGRSKKTLFAYMS